MIGNMKFKFWLNIATFAAIGIIVFLAWHDIRSAFEKMLTLNLWILALVIPAQFFAFFAIAKVYQHFFKVIGQPISLKTLVPASIELNFVNHVFPSGGVSGFSYLTMRLKHDDISPAKSTLAQLVRFVFAFISFIGLLLLAIFLLALQDQASRFIIFIATALTCTILFGSLGVLYIVGSEARIHTFTTGLTALLNRLIHLFRRNHPETIRLSRVKLTFHELHKDYLLLRSDVKRMKYVLLWAFIADLADCSLVYITFLAHGVWVNPGAVIIAYAVATTAGLIAILPGGLGVYEPLMAALLLSAGVPGDVALSATLVSRVMTLALALGSGYLLYHLTLNRYARDNSQR